MEGELQHIFHEHKLILKANDGTDQSYAKINCDGCLKPILGPFYRCGECQYFLHKVCAELPNEIDHPMHPQHLLTLFSKPPVFGDGYMFECDLCHTICEGFVYHCSICDFGVDTICAVSSHQIEDKCHMHPLIPIQIPSTFPCHICRKKEEGVSYKCTICPFWIHQSCIVLPNTVKHSAHHHHLTLLPSLPLEYRKFSEYCDICYDKKMFMFQCSYFCEGCKFFAHISCARSETTQSSSSSRDQYTVINQDLPPDGKRLLLLPLKQKSTELISQIVKNYDDRDANIDNKIDHFSHDHPLFLFDEKTNDKICEACAIPMSPPFYGCIECDYCLHKCCTDLPEQILHPSHSEHQLIKGSRSDFFKCICCHQWCNGFYYNCFKCEYFYIDIKCASLLRPVYHEAHRHPIFPRFASARTCSACGYKRISQCILQCDTCSFNLCFICAMAPPINNHRYGKSHPFILTYSPPENHYNEYICEICEGVLNPKLWFYHCLYADQFTHIICMLNCGADSNIKYGKSCMFNVHKHKLSPVECANNSSLCTHCREPLKTGFSVGLECIPCNFTIHLQCLGPMYH